jgi:hypothetical protein
MIIDAWAQHPTLRHMRDPIFESLRRWTKTPSPTVELPVQMAVAKSAEPEPGRRTVKDVIYRRRRRS